MTLPLLTTRLELRPYALEDVDRIQAVLYGDAEARRLTGGPSMPEQTLATIQGYIELQDRLGYAFWAVRERETSQLVGEAGLKPYEGGGADVELGYAFRTASWGIGYATEAGKAVVAEAFGPLELDRLVAVTSDDNHGSQRVLRKLGFVADGHREVYGASMLYLVLERD
jgi:RimJ/RimL family protein N-acetyltransferase